LEGGDGGVGEGVLVGGVGKVERGFVDQGTPDRPRAASACNLAEVLVSGPVRKNCSWWFWGQPRADRWVVEDGDVGGDQRDDVAWARKTAIVAAQVDVSSGGCAPDAPICPQRDH
jgi:hypothetical protein